MSDEVRKGLLDSVRAAPHDDAPRWVFADYLESSGETDRARFVRSQIEAAGLDAWDPQRVRLRVEQRALLQRHDASWRAELPELDGVVWGPFDRGFVGRVAFDSVAAIAAHAAACSRAVPLSGVIFRWPRLEERDELAAIEGLREVTVVGTLMQPEDVQWLANSPLLSTVRVLNLVETQMEAEALRHLLASPWLAQLEVLRLPVHNFGNEGIELLTTASLPNLVELDVSVASQDDLGSGGRYLPTMDEAGATVLSTWPGLARLRALDLTGNQVGIDGLARILSSPRAVGLKALRIRGVADFDWENDGDRPDVLLAMGSTASGMALDELDISECGLTDGSAAVLVGSPALAGLKVLRFNYTQGDTLDHVMQAPWCESLRILSVNDCGQNGMQTVLSRALPQLHTLSMASTYYWSRTQHVAKVFASAPPQPSLLELDLTDCGIQDAGLAKLGKVTSLPALISLRLGSEDEVEFSEEAASRFASSPLGAQLGSLDCGYEGVDRAPEPDAIAVGEGEYRGSLRNL